LYLNRKTDKKLKEVIKENHNLIDYLQKYSNELTPLEKVDSIKLYREYKEKQKNRHGLN
jgi:transposase